MSERGVSYSSAHELFADPNGNPLANRGAARARYYDIMKRFVEAEDTSLSDDALCRKAWERYLKDRQAVLVDPNE